jgi:hypothetical protein
MGAMIGGDAGKSQPVFLAGGVSFQARARRRLMTVDELQGRSSKL